MSSKENIKRKKWDANIFFVKYYQIKTFFLYCFCYSKNYLWNNLNQIQTILYVRYDTQGEYILILKFIHRTIYRIIFFPCFPILKKLLFFIGSISSSTNGRKRETVDQHDGSQTRRNRAQVWKVKLILYGTLIAISKSLAHLNFVRS